MFTQKELIKLSSIIDGYCPTDDEEAMDLSSKLYDLIQLYSAWDINGYIEITIKEKML